MSNTQLLNSIIFKNYSLGPLQELVQVGGFSALNYRATINNKFYFVKVYQNPDLQKVATVVQLQELLSSQGIPVVSPLRNNEGSFYVAGDNIALSVYPWIEGTVRHEPDFDLPSLNFAASALAKLHMSKETDDILLPESSDSLKTPDLFKMESGDLFSRFDAAGISKEAVSKIEALVSLKSELLSKVISHEDFRSFLQAGDLVHGDFHNENLLYVGDTVKVILDFELAHYGHRLEDVANFILFACCNTGFDTSNISKARSFIKEYNRCYPFTLDELAFSVRYRLYTLCSSLFLERKFLETKDDFFLVLFDRDIKKFGFFKSHLGEFISKLGET